jgi:molybdate transport system permease protein
VDRDLEDAARAMGAGEGQVFRHVTLPLSWRFLLTGTVLGFARGLGEFGATLMVAGNIPGETQTVPTAIYIAVETGRMDLAAYWVAAVVFLSFFLLGIVQRIK